MFKTNVKYKGTVKISPWRKTALGTWQVTGDSQIYSMVSADASALLEYLKQNPGVTITHVMGSLLGKVIEKYPQINCIERFGKLYQREDIAIFFQVASDQEGTDLTGYTVRQAHKKTPQEIAEEMRKSVKKIKEGDDKDYKKVKNTLRHIPGLFMGIILKALSFLLYQLNLWTKSLGSPRDSFGSMMVTNIGTLGMQRGWAPLVPYSRVPVLLTLGRVYDRPVAKDGQVVIQPTIDCCFTTDHRIIDGVVGSKMEKEFIKLFTNPHLLHGNAQQP